MIVGILALQGDVKKHSQILKKLKIENRPVRYVHEFDGVQGLIIPGGESTTITHLIQKNKLYEHILSFAENFPILGTCAGLIMMSKKVDHPLVRPLGIMDLEVDRNGYGRQVHSFVGHLDIRLNGYSKNIPATFIRAPKISKMGKDVEVMAEFNGNPCAVRQGKHIALAFHPELDGIDIFHRELFNNNEKVSGSSNAA